METNRNKTRIKLLITLVPGLHLRAVQRLTGLSFASTRYHVDTLQKSGEIVRAEEGGFSRLYPNGISDSDKAIFSVLNRPTDRRILSYMIQKRDISLRDLCVETGCAKSTISEHLSTLVSIGVVRVLASDENHSRYELVDSDRIKSLIEVRNPTMLSRATDRFIEVWDF